MSDPRRTSPAQFDTAIIGEAPIGAQSTATLLGQVMSLVALALGAAAVGAAAGRDLGPGAALVLSLGAVGMLLVQAFGGDRFRAGRFAVVWLVGVAVVLGLGLGPLVSYYAAADPFIVVEAAGATALVVLGVATAGFATGRDLAGWMRGLAWAALAIVVVGTVLLLLGIAGSPVLSLAIAVVSAALILVDFNYLRHHGTPGDAVILATGIFGSIVNLFVSLLDLFDRDR
jgi:FtsH-binding integral membrane protein